MCLRLTVYVETVKPLFPRIIFEVKETCATVLHQHHTLTQLHIFNQSTVCTKTAHKNELVTVLLLPSILKSVITPFFQFSPFFSRLCLHIAPDSRLKRS